MVKIKHCYESETDSPVKFDDWNQAHMYELKEAIRNIFPEDILEDEELRDRLADRMARDIVEETPEAVAAWNKLTDVAARQEPVDTLPTIPFEHSPKPAGVFGGRLSSMLKNMPETKHSKLREVT